MITKKEKDEILNFAYKKATGDNYEAPKESEAEIKYKNLDSTIVSFAILVFFLFLALFLVLYVINASPFLSFVTIIYTHILPVIAIFTLGYVGSGATLKILSLKKDRYKLKDNPKLRFTIKLISALFLTLILLLILL